VDNETKEIIKTISLSGIVATLGATVRALLAPKEEPIWRTVRTLLAGIFFGILIGLIFMNTQMSPFMKTALTAVAGSFVATLWPLLERLSKKFLIKKANDLGSTNNP
jgi:uncharacterized membrane protein